MDLGNLLKVDKKKVGDDLGIVYVLEIPIPDDNEVYVKVGITSKTDAHIRWNQINTSIWKQYRKFAAIYPKRFKQTNDIHAKEKILLDYLKEYQCGPKKRIDGATECHIIPLDIVVEVYDKLMKGDLDMNINQWGTCKECGRDKKFVKFNDNGSEELICGYDCENKKKEGKANDKNNNG